MSAIVIVDTSILLNLFACPGRCDQAEEVIDQLEEHIENDDHLFLPLAAIIETGNHISHVNNGNARRKAAERFAKGMRDAINDIAPWKPIGLPSVDDLLAWLVCFPDNATKEIGMGDTSIIEEFNQSVKKWPQRRVTIWSLDEHLSAYDHKPRPWKKAARVDGK